jgi:hypothetical protein
MQVVVKACGLCALCARAYSITTWSCLVLHGLLLLWTSCCAAGWKMESAAVCALVFGPQHVVGESRQAVQRSAGQAMFLTGGSKSFLLTTYNNCL